MSLYFVIYLLIDEVIRTLQIFSLVCDFGGILGLYVGFSLLTIFEFIDFGFELLCAACVTLTKGGAKRGQHEGSADHGSQARGHRVGPVSTHAAWGAGQTGKVKQLKGDIFAGTPPPAYIGLESVKLATMVEVEC